MPSHRFLSNLNSLLGSPSYSRIQSSSSTRLEPGVLEPPHYTLYTYYSFTQCAKFVFFCRKLWRKIHLILSTLQKSCFNYKLPCRVNFTLTFLLGGYSELIITLSGGLLPDCVEEFVIFGTKCCKCPRFRNQGQTTTATFPSL